MTPPSLQDALQISGLALPNAFPRSPNISVPSQLPLAFVPIEELTTVTLARWLTARRIVYKVDGPSRRLHGALAARGGCGIVFIDSTDSVEEQRFTSAHETAHFIDDDLVPRRIALKVFGEKIRPVLDGKRAPTPGEALSAVLNRAPLGVHVHLMARGS